MLKRPRRADQVDAAEKATDPLAIVGRAEFRPLPRTARIDRETETGEYGYRAVAEIVHAGRHQRRDDRNLGSREFARERVLFRDRLVGPAPGSVELDDHRFGVLETHLEDPVFVAPEREHPPVHGKSGRFDRVDDQIRRQGRKRSTRLSWYHRRNISRSTDEHHPRHRRSRLHRQPRFTPARRARRKTGHARQSLVRVPLIGAAWRIRARRHRRCGARRGGAREAPHRHRDALRRAHLRARVGVRAAEVLPQQHRKHAHAARMLRRRRREAFRVLVDRRGVRHSGRRHCE